MMFPKKPKLEPIETEVEECNIGSEQKPKMIKLSKTLPTHIKLKYIELLRNFLMYLHGVMKI